MRVSLIEVDEFWFLLTLIRIVFRAVFRFLGLTTFFFGVTYKLCIISGVHERNNEISGPSLMFMLLKVVKLAVASGFVLS